MKYNGMYERSEKEERTKSVLSNQYKFTEPGQQLNGMLLGIEQKETKRFKRPFFVYTMETDEGVVNFILGEATDKRLGDSLKVGKIYHIEYKGKVHLSNGRDMNNYYIAEIPTDNEPYPKEKRKARTVKHTPGKVDAVVDDITEDNNE